MVSPELSWTLSSSRAPRRELRRSSETAFHHDRHVRNGALPMTVATAPP